jgi:hypothetical protein
VSKAKRALSEMAKDYAEEALLTLAEIMRNDKEAANARVSAANALLDRGYGKPVQANIDIPPEQAPQAFDGWSIERAKKPDTPDAD